MRTSLNLLLFFQLTNFFNCQHSEGSEFNDANFQLKYGQLMYSSVFFRHGDRTPLYIKLDDGDPQAPIMWPITNRAQLTNIGKEQLYNCGQWYREHYLMDGTTNGYQNDLITMSSSNSDRAIMSAEAFLAGAFPPIEAEQWANDNLLWQPIPVFTTDEKIIGIQDMDECDRYKIEKKLLNQSPELLELNNTFNNLFTYLAQHSGYNKISTTDVIENVHQATRCYNELFIEELYNLSLPVWTRSIYPEPLKYLSNLYVALQANTVEMKRLTAGRLLGRIVDEMNKKRSGLLKKEFHMYSGHETALTMLLCLLESYSYDIPPYGSSLIIDLRVKNKEYVVTIFFKNSTTDPPYQLQYPGCKGTCTLDKFIRLTKHLIPENWEVECNLSIFEKIYYSDYFTAVLVFLPCLLIGFLIMSYRHIIKQRTYQRIQFINDFTSPSD